MEQTRSFLSRRKLLIGLSGAVAAAAALVAAPFRTAIVTTARDLVRNQPALHRLVFSLADAGDEEWLDQVGTIFTVGGGTSLKLVAVTPMTSVGRRPAGLRDRAFLAQFDVQNRGTMAGDLIYIASHPSYGAFRIFLSASSAPNLPYRMTALFN